MLPPDVKTVFIPIVENNTTELGYASAITEALRDRFERFGAVSVVDTEAGADAVLKSKILKVDQATQSVASQTDTALQQSTTVTMFLELKRRDGTLLWRNPRLAVSKAFGSESSAVVTSSADFAGSSLGGSDLSGLGAREVQRGQEQDAVGQIAEEAARIVYEQAVAPDF